jgi:hypothetical protein
MADVNEGSAPETSPVHEGWYGYPCSGRAVPPPGVGEIGPVIPLGLADPEADRGKLPVRLQGRTSGAPGLTAPAVTSEDGREQSRGNERPG